MRVKTPRIVPARSGWFFLWVGLLVVLGALMLVAWLGDYRFDQTVDRVTPLKLQVAAQREQIEQLEAERGRLREQLAVLERTSQVDRESIRQVREALQKSQSGYREMERELRVLRGIVDAGVKSEGLFVRGFSLSRGEQPGSYRYRFTVSQALKNSGAAVGWILLSLEGKRAGEPVTLPLSELTEEKVEKLKMRFRHFQDVDGVLQVPEDFNPERLTVELKPTSNRLPETRASFDWRVAD